MPEKAVLFATEGEAVDAALAVAKDRFLNKNRKRVCLELYASLGFISVYELKRGRGGPVKDVVGRFGWVVPPGDST